MRFQIPHFNDLLELFATGHHLVRIFGADAQLGQIVPDGELDDFGVFYDLDRTLVGARNDAAESLNEIIISVSGI